ncbi:MAG: hypothetical protein C0475_03340 [Planctomyces sp.]|nr:hypothetical protein [Planctomyces sp.]MBA4039078.1 hypothetical protein [Planctomyces sp.]MBA4119495.1 hypothetical protein [Isosphaera sp.]
MAILLVSAATAWLIVLSGLWVAFEWSARFPALRHLSGPFGVMLIAAGQFVFAVLVADRLFPRASLGLRAGFETLTAGVFLVGTATAAWRLATGGI